MKYLRLAALLAVIPFTACGGGGAGQQTSTVTPSTQTPAPNISGNWDFAATSVVTIGPASEIGATLSSNGNAFSGNLRALSATGVSDAVPISGTIGASNLLSASTPAAATQVITVSGIIATDGKSLSSGSYSSTGTVADHGSISGFMVPSLTGSWTLNSSAAPTIFHTELTQTLNSDGTSTLRWGIILTGSSCFASNEQLLGARESPLIGAHLSNMIFIIGDPADGSTIGDVVFSGAVDQSGKTVTGSFRINHTVKSLVGPCDGLTGTATMVRA